jgi:predicted HicB family RNase H-like nuclease
MFREENGRNVWKKYYEEGKEGAEELSKELARVCAAIREPAQHPSSEIGPMATLSLRLPESVHAKLAELAEQEGISINQLINSAVAEKLAALMTEEYLSQRAERGSARRFDAILAKIPAAAPIKGDEMPSTQKRRKRRRAG